jgi:hypothetical protein
VPWTDDRGLSEDRQQGCLKRCHRSAWTQQGQKWGPTLGSVETEAVSAETQEIVRMVNELAADVLGFCGQAVVGLGRFENMYQVFMEGLTRRG